MPAPRARTRAAAPMLLIGSLVSLGGCGGGTTVPVCATVTPQPIEAVTTRTGPVSVTADRRVAVRGGQVHVAVTASGPARLTAPCAAPVSLVVVDVAGLHVFSSSPAAASGEPCGAVELAGGQTATWRLTWDVDATLPVGTYLLDVVAGDSPDVTLPVTVAVADPLVPVC